MIQYFKKLKARRAEKANREERTVRLLNELLTLTGTLNRTITENTELLAPMIENLTRYFQVELDALDHRLKEAPRQKSTPDDLLY